MTIEELPGLGWIESPPDDRDWGIADLFALTGADPLATLPASYIAPSPWPPVLNQGSTPQCVAFSLSTVKAWEDLRDQGRFDFDEGRFFAEIGGTPGGAIIRNGLARMFANGFPVVGAGNETLHRIAVYVSVPVTRADICAAIVAFGPLEIGTPWASSWFRPHADGTLPQFDTIAGGHALVAIGFDARGLRLRNSWGTGWGLSGDAILPWAELTHIREAWKALDRIEVPVKPKVWEMRFAAGATVRVAIVTPTVPRRISASTVQRWGPRPSAAPCRAPVVLRGTISGQATVALVTRGVFAGRWIRVRAADGVTVTST